MTRAQMASLLTAIAERVYGDESKITLSSTGGCAPVKLQIGFINNIVQHDGIVITDAPPVITELVMDWVVKNGSGDDGPPVAASAGFGGLFIR